MKKINNSLKATIGGLGTLLLLMSSCNDSFMDRYPETDITEKVFFKTPKDLETYTNGFYGTWGSGYWDVASDNVIYLDDSGIYQMMRGEKNPRNIGTWDWSDIRAVNFMLARTGTVEGDPVEKNHYIGFARLVRAQRYYNKVSSYSDVPWYSRDLGTDDTELLYKTQDPRTLVVDSIMADLDFAVKNMKSGTSRTRINREAALAIQARIALTEGTFRKYHTELGLTDADRFLEIAAKAAGELISGGQYELSREPKGDIPAYEALFCSTDLSNNKEMILFEDYDKSLGRMHNAQAMFDWTTSLSRDLMEDYEIEEDGEWKPFYESKGYKTKDVHQVFENRDPRFSQTFMRPGFTRPGSNKPHIPKLSTGGYPQVKFSPRTYDQISWGLGYTDLPVIRYAEVLLIYAEAKAELGTLTEEDVNLTINDIRQRAGLPATSLAEWNANPDQVQAARYPNVTSSQKNAILEIRRERRIELACEGFRYGDLKRWACGKLMEKAPEGVYIPGMGYYDVNGDGQPDIAVVKTQADADAIPQEDKDKYKLTVYPLEGATFELSEGDKGYVRLVSQVGKFTFVEPKYYYTPIDVKDIVLNPNLKQNKFWEGDE